MIFTKKLNDNWENDLWHAIGEQDILTLRNTLNAIQDSLNQSFMSIESSVMEEINSWSP